MGAGWLFFVLRLQQGKPSGDPVQQVRPIHVPPADQRPVPAFPGSPRMPLPRVKDLSVPSAPTAPGAIGPQYLATNVPLSVEEAVRIALHEQPSLGVQKGAILNQQGQTREIGANEHPQVIVSAGIDDLQGFGGASGSTILSAPATTLVTGASPTLPYEITAGARQLIYDFNLTRNLVRQSESLERSASQNLTVAQQNLAQGVESAFFNYTDAIREVQVNEANLVNRQRQLDLARARLANGVGEPLDLATAQTSKSQGVLLLNQARNTAEQARITLLQQMGIDPMTPVLPVNEFARAPSSHDPKALTMLAINTRPEVKSAEASLLAAKYGLSAAKAVNLPSIYAEGGIGLGGKGLLLDQDTANVGAGFSFPLIDGGYRNGAVKIANGQLVTADANLKTAILQVRTDVSAAYMALLSAEQRVEVGENEVYNAQEDVRIAEGRYAAGAGLFQDITTAQGLLLTSMTDLEQARNALDIARVQLRRATGELVSDLASAASK